ncbi:MAG: hypothetical protein M3O67_06975, partial [Bacteroidota bacterium]|nr:hypothetical protein [Bacteroidota bacterium]
MKKITNCIMLVLISIASFSQQVNPAQPLTADDYLQKGKKQKSAARVLLGGGAGLVGIGFLIGDRKESSFDDAATGFVVGGVG